MDFLLRMQEKNWRHSFRSSNTYLNVFAVLGAFGMILGIAGLGFVLLRNYNITKTGICISFRDRIFRVADQRADT